MYNGLFPFFTKNRETCFLKGLEPIKEIATEMDIQLVFHTRHKMKRIRQFDEGTNDASRHSEFTDESFMVNYSYPLSIKL